MVGVFQYLHQLISLFCHLLGGALGFRMVLPWWIDHACILKGSNQAILILLPACIYALHMRGHIRVLDYLPMLLILIMPLHHSLLLLLLIFIALHAAQHPFITTVRVHCIPRRWYVLSVEDILMRVLLVEGGGCWDIWEGTLVVVLKGLFQLSIVWGTHEQILLLLLILLIGGGMVKGG